MRSGGVQCGAPAGKFEMSNADDVSNAQAAVIRSLQKLKRTVIQANDSVSYLNAEVLNTFNLHSTQPQ